MYLSAQDVTESSFTVSWDPTQAQIDCYSLSFSSSDGSSGSNILSSSGPRGVATPATRFPLKLRQVSVQMWFPVKAQTTSQNFGLWWSTDEISANIN